jgi:hypothetical protein
MWKSKWKSLFGKPPIRVWVIKQIDADLLHLCGEGHVSPDGPRASHGVLTALSRGEYHGAVEMLDNGFMLNARLFVALLPGDAFYLDASGLAHWQGRSWRVSRVPQRCWTYTGPLVADPMPHGESGWVSSEDVSDIRRRAESEPRATSPHLQFGAADDLEGEAAFAQRWRRRIGGTPPDK